MKKNKVVRKVKEHLEDDIETFKEEAAEDRKLIAKLKDNPKKKQKSPKSPKAKNKIKKVMEEYKEGELRSGSKKGPVVKSRKQAIAIALSEARKASKSKPAKRKKKSKK